MSDSYYLVCKARKTLAFVGHSKREEKMCVISLPDQLEALRGFLESTAGEELVFLSDSESDQVSENIICECLENMRNARD